MTTSVAISNPIHATWDVVCTITEGVGISEVLIQEVVIEPGNSNSMTIWGNRKLTIVERPRN